jgi:Caspase domain
MKAFFGLLCLLCLGSTAWAGKLALIVGNNVGSGEDPRLRYAERDARRVAETLREVGGVAAADLVLLAGNDAGTVRRALARLVARTTPGTTFYFYYSGHAGVDGLHVRGETLAWEELRAFSDTGDRDLRIVLVDACHAGQLARAKGFVAVPARDGEPAGRGAAVLAAAEWYEAAQESDALGGSFFTHALVSGLRGAADLDRDGVVTLTELHSHVSRDTSLRTARAGLRQHPTYRFDIAGRGDIVLANLRSGEARIVLGASIGGTVLVVEHGSSSVLVEAGKRDGETLVLAVPKGRYQVLVRDGDRIGVTDVTLAWGGEAHISASQLSPRSLQEVALKGSRLDLRRRHARVGASLASPPLAGSGLLPSIFVAAGQKLGRVDVGVRTGLGRTTFGTVDTEVTMTAWHVGAFAALEWPRRRWDLRAFVAADVTRVWQDVGDATDRRGWVPGAGVGLGARIPIASGAFLEAAAEARLETPEIDEAGRRARALVRAELAVGWAF